jgi:hypothetical protein
MEAFTTFLQNLKDGNERLVREQLQRNPAFLMLGLVTAAKAMQVNYCQFLIRLGASSTTKVKTLEGNYTASDHLARALAAASVPPKTIEAVLLLLAREEQLFFVMEKLRKILASVDALLPSTVTNKEWLQKYRETIEPLVTKYLGDLFNTERTRSQTEALIGEVTPLISAFTDNAPLLKEEQLKIKAAAIEAARKKALKLGLSPITLASDRVPVDAPHDSQPIEEMVEVVRQQVVSLSVARSVDSVPLGDLPSITPSDSSVKKKVASPRF